VEDATVHRFDSYLAPAILAVVACAGVRAAEPGLDSLRRENDKIVRQFNDKQRELQDVRAALRKSAEIQPLVTEAEAAAKALQEIQANDPEIKAALVAQHKSVDDLDQIIAAEAAGSREIAAIDKEIEAASAKLHAVQVELRTAEQKRIDWRKKIETENEKVVKAKKAAQEALATYRAVSGKKIGDARAVADKSRAVLEEALRKKTADDPKAAAMDKELDDLLQKNRELVAKINDILRNSN
jgi:chromosome segregation ATPase